MVNVLVIGLVIWLQVLLYCYCFVYMVTGLVVCLLDSLYGYWFGDMVTVSVI